MLMTTKDKRAPSDAAIKPLVFGLVGLGGYGGSICDVLTAAARREHPAARLTAVCEPDLTTHARRAAALREAGVKVFSKYEDLLAEPVEAVWLPIPIHLHRPFTEQALAAGKAVMCEKPAAGAVQDLDAMIAARDRTGLPTAVGFQDIYDPMVQAAKRRLLAGELGAIRHATLYACWPRDSHYYGRAGWAGALKRDGVWVLDSPANNATAHFINLILFLLGPDERTSATPASIEAELYRANPIENYDTCALRIRLADGAGPGGAGAEVVVLLTHACQRSTGPHIRLDGAAGALLLGGHADLTFVPASGPREPHRRPADPRQEMVRLFAAHARGDRAATVATLEIARQHLLTVNGASEAAPVRTVPESAVETTVQPKGGTLRAIRDIEAAFERCAAERKLLHESGLFDWTRRAGTRDLRGYSEFKGVPRE